MQSPRLGDVMKFLLFALLVSTAAYAEQYLFSLQPRTSKTTASGGSPIPTSFGTGSQSRVMTGLSKYGHIAIFNGCEDEAVAVNFSFGSTPTDGNSANVYIPGGIGLVLDNVPVGANVYLRSDTGAPITTACSVFITVW